MDLQAALKGEQWLPTEPPQTGPKVLSGGDISQPPSRPPPRAPVRRQLEEHDVYQNAAVLNQV